MGYKCAPQIMGLVRNEPKPNAKRRANGSKILEELGNERYSKSETLDRTRSKLNEYNGFSRGKDAWESMCNTANEYRFEGTNKNGKKFSRSLREDAVIGYALIFNPPAEMTQGWSRAQYRKFYNDCWACMQEINPDLFHDDNTVMKSIHRDEGLPSDDGTYSEHMHHVGYCRDRDGRFCGNTLDSRLCIEINKRFPELMRQRGYDLDDLDTTDWQRMKSDEEYRTQRKAKRKEQKSGLSVNRYIQEKAKKTNEALVQANQLMTDLQKAQDELAKYEDDAVTAANKRANEIRQEALEIRKQAKEDAKKIKAKAAEDVKSEFEQLMKKMTELLDEVEAATDTDDEASFHLAEERRIPAKNGKSLYDVIEAKRQKKKDDFEQRKKEFLRRGNELQKEHDEKQRRLPNGMDFP